MPLEQVLESPEAIAKRCQVGIDSLLTRDPESLPLSPAFLHPREFRIPFVWHWKRKAAMGVYLEQSKGAGPFLKLVAELKEIHEPYVKLRFVVQGGLHSVPVIIMDVTVDSISRLTMPPRKRLFASLGCSPRALLKVGFVPRTKQTGIGYNRT